MLRTRLFLNLVPFVVMLLATGIYAILLFSRLASSVDAAISGNYQCVVASQRMKLALAEMERAIWGASDSFTGKSGSFKESQKEFQGNLEVILNHEAVAGQKEQVRLLQSEYAAYCRELATTSGLASLQARQRAYDARIVPQGSLIKTSLDRILTANQKAILAASQQGRQITRQVTRLMVLGMVIALAISAYACVRLSRSVLQPIQQLTQATRQLGEGKMSQPVPVLSRDELGELALAFNKMAAQLQEYRQSTSEEIVRLHRTMETTLASFPDPIFVLDHEGTIELKNPAAEDLSTALGVNGQLPPRLHAIARHTLDSGENFLPNSFKEVATFRVNGGEKYFLPRVLAMRTKENSLFGVAVVLYDVTRFRLLDAAKSDLVATVSHEFKTPLTSIRMVLHILLEKTIGSLTAKQDELIQAARNDSERLLRILNDLLDLARLEEGASELNREDIAPGELLQTVIEELADKAAARALKLDCHIDADLPRVSVDRQRINHVFANLLTNAIKHSPAGSDIHLRASNGEDGVVLFSVADSGPGISAEYQTRIFDRFFRVPGQARTGAGLGLSIAREIAVAHGGRLWVKSVPGQGATFCFALKAAG